MTDTIVVSATPVVVVVDPGGVATAIAAAGVRAHQADPNPHPQYAAALAAHRADPAAHPDRPTLAAAALFAAFFGA
jgi:hypothetical protein